jgi:hypothetical protein
MNPDSISTPAAAAAPEADRAALIAALESVSDWPALIAKRQRVAKRIKPYLTEDASHQLYLAWLAYSTAVGRNVSQSLLIRRAIALLAARAVQMGRRPGIRKAEAAAVGVSCERPEDAR